MANKEILLFAEKLGNIKKFADASLKKILQIHAKDVLAAQQHRIHFKGQDRSNNRFGNYSQFTINIKQKKNQFTDYIILHDTGKFKKSQFIKVKGTNYEFGATDEKTDMLREDYAPLLGADESEKTRMQKIVKFSLINFLKKQLMP